MLNFKILSQKRGQDDGSQYCATATAKGTRANRELTWCSATKGKGGSGKGHLRD